MRIKNTRVLGTAGALIAVAATLAACSSSTTGTTSSAPAMMGLSQSGSMMSGNSMMSMSNSDQMFLAMMVPHHQQAVEMSDLVLQTTTNSDVKALAEQIKSAQGPEIEQMKQWLGPEGMMNAHSMGDDGMLTAKQMAALKAATGAERDRLYLEGMIQHHQGAIAMAKTELADGDNAEVMALAQAVVDAQQAEIAKMQEMLQQ